MADKQSLYIDAIIVIGYFSESRDKFDFGRLGRREDNIRTIMIHERIWGSQWPSGLADSLLRDGLLTRSCLRCWRGPFTPFAKETTSLS